MLYINHHINMKIIKLLLLAMLLQATAAFAQDLDSLSPDEIVKQTVAEVLTSFKEDKGILHDHRKMEHLVATTVLPRFDFVYMTQLTIDEKNWTAASPQDQSALVDEYRTFLAHMFSRSLSQYDNEVVTFAPFETSSGEDRVVVKSKLSSPGDDPDEMDFKLEKTANGWMVYDIELGGVDLIKTYKSNFKSAFEHGGVANLISELHKKNQEVKAANKE
jgi:phospholipid transport system substrate-binding protein